MRTIRFQGPYGGVAALIAAGCATATVGEDPGFLTPDGYAGTSVGAAAAAGSGGDSGTGPTAGVGGATARAGRGNTSAGRGGSVGSGGRMATSAGGRSAMFGGLAGGATSSAAGSTFTGGAGTASVGACPNPRMPATPGATNGNSGSFDTTGEVCYFVEGSFNQWACSNLGGRTVTINGMPAMCGGALPAPVDGGYYFDFGASSDGTNYTSFYWYTS